MSDYLYLYAGIKMYKFFYVCVLRFFLHYFIIILFLFIFLNLESRSKVLSASQIVGAAPDGYSHVDTDRHSDSTKEGNVQTHKGYMGKTITTGNEIKPKLEKKKGNIIY